MLFKTWGNKNNKAIVLLHGGGLSWWSNQELIESLNDSYYVVSVIIDGHGENADQTFLSIENSAKILIDYIDKELNEKTYALIGLSLGAQIIVETISQRSDITEYIILESASLYPSKFIGKFSSIVINSFFWLIKYKWFAKIQAKELFISENKFDLYYEDTNKIKKQTLINILKSSFNYELKNSVEKTKAKALIIVGEKEIKKILRSAEILKTKIKKSEIFIAKNMRHGEFSLFHYNEYFEILKTFFNNERIL